MGRTDFWRVLQHRNPTSLSADITVSTAPRHKKKRPVKPRNIPLEVAETKAANEAMERQQAGERTDWAKVMKASRHLSRSIRRMIDDDDGWRPSGG